MTLHSAFLLNIGRFNNHFHYDIVLNCCRQYTVPGSGGCKDTQIELYGPPVSSVPLRVCNIRRTCKDTQLI